MNNQDSETGVALQLLINGLVGAFMLGVFGPVLIAMVFALLPEYTFLEALIDIYSGMADVVTSAGGSN